jgi:hypothetical protein
LACGAEKKLGKIATATPKQRAAQMKALLLVTWMVYGQPPSSYPTIFNSMEACQIAREAVLQEDERLKREVAEYNAASARGRGFGNMGTNIPGPMVTAICTPQ